MALYRAFRFIGLIGFIGLAEFRVYGLGRNRQRCHSGTGPQAPAWERDPAMAHQLQDPDKPMAQTGDMLSKALAALCERPSGRQVMHSLPQQPAR